VAITEGDEGEMEGRRLGKWEAGGLKQENRDK